MKHPSVSIQNGRVLDGCGNPWFKSDILVKDSRISLIKHNHGCAADLVIDASGKYVCPGFVDIHAHSDVTTLLNPHAASKLHQGITTDLVGNCGWSAAPLSSSQERREVILDKLRTSLPAIPENWPWNSYGEYRDCIQMGGMAINLAGLVGHSTLRASVLGAEARAPSVSELSQMKDLLAQAMDEGAFGMSTGLAYSPGCYADVDELVELAKVVARKGGFYASHIRSLHDGIFEATREAIEIGRRAEIPVQISHFTPRTSMQGCAHSLMELLTQARAGGVDVTCDLFVYTHGQANLRAFLPPWAREGGDNKIIARVKDPTCRERIKEEWRAGIPAGVSPKLVLATSGKWDQLWVQKAIQNTELEGRTIKAISLERKCQPLDLLLDLLVEEDAKVLVAGHDAVERDIEHILQHPLSMLGTDGIALAPYGELNRGLVHSRSYGNHARVLEQYVVERETLTLAQAIRKMTSAPARRIGLRDRGVLKEGMKADIIVFGLSDVRDNEEDGHASGCASGFTDILVNGIPTVLSGEWTGATQGTFLAHMGEKEDGHV